MKVLSFFFILQKKKKKNLSDGVVMTFRRRKEKQEWYFVATEAGAGSVAPQTQIHCQTPDSCSYIKGGVRYVSSPSRHSPAHVNRHDSAPPPSYHNSNLLASYLFDGM